MNRRSFVGRALAALGLAASARPAAAEPSYVYDWRAGYTDDPAFAGRPLPYGGKDVHQVFLDGMDVTDLPIVHLRTGPNGLVRYNVRSPDGTYLLSDDGGTLKTLEAVGHVRYVYHGSTAEDRAARESAAETTSIGNRRWRTYQPKAGR